MKIYDNDIFFQLKKINSRNKRCTFKPLNVGLAVHELKQQELKNTMESKITHGLHHRQIIKVAEKFHKWLEKAKLKDKIKTIHNSSTRTRTFIKYQIHRKKNLLH